MIRARVLAAPLIAASIAVGLLGAPAGAAGAESRPGRVPADAHIAFVDGGTLWAQPLVPDAEPRQVLGGLSMTAGVVASRDGSTLAVLTYEDVWVLRTDTGAARRVLDQEVGAAALSPDGDELYWSAPRDDTPAVHAVPTVGGPGRILAEPAIEVVDLDVSPDGATLAMTSGGRDSLGGTVHALDLGTGRTTRVGEPRTVDYASYGGPGGALVVGTREGTVLTADGFDLFPALSAETAIIAPVAAPEGVYAVAPDRPEDAQPPTPFGPSLWLAPADGAPAVPVLAPLPHVLFVSAEPTTYVVLHGPLPTPAALTPRAESIRTSVLGARPAVGDKVDIWVSVRLSTPGSATATLQQWTNGRWTALRTLPLAGEEIGFSQRLRANARLRVQAAGAVSKPFTVGVAARVRATATRSNGQLVVRGTVQGPAGGRVALQRRTAPGWRTTATAPVGDGRFTFPLDRADRLTLRVVRAATSTHVAGISSVIRVRN